MRHLVVSGIVGLAVLTAAGRHPAAGISPLPDFGRDTVLVYRIENEDHADNFVVRIAEFQPRRFVEWESATTQGTILMSEKAVAGARIFLNSRLFEAGVDTRGKDATTLWLSRKAFSDLKARGRLKLALDSVDCWMTAEGSETVTVEVNRNPTPVPVLRVQDERGAVRWFLDDEGNPLLVKHALRKFTQTLASITTDRQNTLRWIKGKKLTAPR